jgi:hypothetical protein
LIEYVEIAQVSEAARVLCELARQLAAWGHSWPASKERRANDGAALGDQPLMKARRSAFTSSFCVVHMPCGAPL